MKKILILLLLFTSLASAQTWTRYGYGNFKGVKFEALPSTIATATKMLVIGADGVVAQQLLPISSGTIDTSTLTLQKVLENGNIYNNGQVSSYQLTPTYFNVNFNQNSFSTLLKFDANEFDLLVSPNLTGEKRILVNNLGILLQHDAESGGGNYHSLGLDDNGFYLKSENSEAKGYIKTDVLSADETFQLPGNSGTLALVTDITDAIDNIAFPNSNTDISYVPSTRNVVSSTGTGFEFPLADATNAGLLSNTDKSKIDNLPTVYAPTTAEENVNADWNATSGDAQILNKPTIPTLVSQLSNDANFVNTTQLATKANSSHTHVIADVTNLQTTLDSKVNGSGTSTGTNTGDNAVNSLYSGLVSNATHTGDVTGATALTLATVNSNVGSFTNANVTVNAKGLVTAVSNGTASQPQLNGTGFVKANGTTVSYDNSTYLTGITSGNVTTALGFTPYNSTNPSGYISTVPAQSFASLTGKPTTLSGYGITDAYPLTSNPSGFLTTELNTGTLKTANNLSDLSNVATARTNLGLGTLATSSATIPTNTNQLTNGSGFIATETDAVVKAINGIVKSNGTTISAAVAGTDYALPNTNTTGTASNITSTTNSTLTSLPNLAVTQTQVTGLATALATKEPTVTAGTTTQYYRGDKSWQTLDKSTVGLSNVDNTTDLNKPISTGTQTALNGKANTTHTHTISDVTSLQTTLDAKQASLVSGTNIKNINGTSILGSGDIVFKDLIGDGVDIFLPNTTITDSNRFTFYEGNFSVENQFGTLSINTEHTRLLGGPFEMQMNSTDFTIYNGNIQKSIGLDNTNLYFNNIKGIKAYINNDLINITNKTFTLPNKSGTFALLDDITGGGATNLTTTTSATSVIVNSDTGTDATINLGNGTNAGLSLNNYTTTEKTKLAGISDGATANSTDAQLRDRSTHTGTQLSTTISDLTTTINTRIGASNVNDLNDVTIATPTTGQVLKYNGTAWVNGTDDTSGGGSVLDESVVVYKTDFQSLAATANAPFIGTATSTGTLTFSNANINKNHPGIARLTSSATANSGYRFVTDASILLGGSEVFTAIINPLNFTTTTFRAGFLDATSTTDAVDGVYFEYLNSGNILFKTSNNSVRSTSPAITTLALNTWYKLKITMNADATSALGEVYNNLGVLISSQTLTTNIPKVLGRETAVGVLAYNSAVVATPMVDLDYIGVKYSLIR
jgi:hypothetical protein